MGVLDDSAAHALDQWGADGWELVQVVPGPTGSDSLVAYLKRPVQESAPIQN